MSKWDQEKDNFVAGVTNLFNNTQKKSNRSKASSSREANPDTVVKRVINQVLIYEDHQLKWRSPEDWDQSYSLISKYRLRRRSEYITSKMTWSEFITRIDLMLLKRSPNSTS